MLSSFFKAFRSVNRRGTKRPRFVPRLIALEDRCLPSTLTVANLNDGGPGSLRAALAAAVGGDTIVFKSDLHGTIDLTSGELQVNTSVTIDGPGADRIAVSGAGASRVFEIAAGLTVRISGLTITDGHALEQGGGILNDGSNLTLSGDDLTQNVAIGSATGDVNGGAMGGALDSVSGTLDITGVKGPNQGKTFLAIYELKGDTLKVCYDLSGKERPTEFKTKPDTQLYLVTYRREKQ